MKKIMGTITTLFVILSFFSGVSFAEEKASVDDVYEKVLEAAEFIKQRGEKGLSEFNDPKGRFVWKDTYVSVSNCKEKKNAAHPDKRPRGVSYNTTACKKTGRLFLLEPCDDVGYSGIWIEYWWTKLGADEIYRKLMFSMPVEGTNYRVNAGIYDENLSVDELNQVIGR
jgi:cytochrome c